MGIIRSKFIALDSSHLGGLASDASSRDARRCRRAAAFLETLVGCGGVLLLCWSHFEELLVHDNERVVCERMDFIRSLPLVAWIRSLTDNTAPGSILDITAREVAEAVKSPRADAVAVRETVAQQIFCLGPGARVIAPFMAEWGQLKPLLRERQARNREIEAISRSDFTGNEDTKVSGWLKGGLRTPEDVERQFEALNHRLSTDIKRRGDRRIVDPSSSAGGFFAGVRQTAADALCDASSPGLQFLGALDVEMSEVWPEMTLGELGDLARFHRQLRHIGEILGIPFAALRKRVKESQLPSCIIQSALRRYRQDTAEWKGSELNDRALACLAAYAGITFVDKRTLESVTQARRKTPIANILLRVERASNYAQAADKIADRAKEC